jgi:hypothetical protein
MILLLIYAFGVAYASYLMDTSPDTGEGFDPENPNDGFWVGVIFETIFCFTSWFFVISTLMGRRLKANHN